MQIYVSLKPTDPTGLLDAIKRLEACSAQVQQRMTYNKLRLNSSKTEFLVVISPSHQRLINITKPLLRIGDSMFFPSTSVRNLGVILDAQMTMRQRVTSIVRSANVQILLDESGGILMRPPLL